jgi:hypothetical protein
LRVAIKANPLKLGQIEAVRDTAAAILLEPSAAPVGQRRRSRAGRDNKTLPIGMILMASLLGYAAMRRRQQARHVDI